MVKTRKEETLKIPNVFVSYCHEEPELTVAKLIAEKLELAGLNVFIDTKIPIGEDWPQRIDQALNESDCFILLFSQKTFQHSFVALELANALRLYEQKNGRPIICPIGVCLQKDFKLLTEHPWGHIYKIQYKVWNNEADTDLVISNILEVVHKDNLIEHNHVEKCPDASLKEGKSVTHSVAYNAIRLNGEALSSRSEVYVIRTADQELIECMQQERAIINLKGAKQTGKTSLVVRQYTAIKSLGYNQRTVIIPFESIKVRLKSLDDAWKAIAAKIARELRIKDWENIWKENASYDMNMEDFLSEFVFRNDSSPLLICFDGVDCIFDSDIKDDFFSTVRSFYNSGAYEQTWENVRWVLSISTEPKFFIKDLSQSPFNIGTKIDLGYFEFKEVKELLGKYNLAFSNDVTHRIVRYLGGHPHLTHVFVNKIARKAASVEDLFDAETAGSGHFREHLNRYLEKLQKETPLIVAMKDVINGNSCKDVKIAHQLEGAGLVKRNTSQNIVPMCELYSAFYGRSL